MDLISGRQIGRYLALLLVGVLVGVVGTGVHRAEAPWGLILALVTVAAAGVLARAWVGWVGVLVIALGVFTTVSVLAGQGPGGDVLVALEPIGVIWYSGALAAGLAAALPRRWFSGAPVGQGAQA
ncbi:hypothetical protein [Actinotalea sp. C106]|uniref:hypothetical protein n=1 Tax=Actinotalea sp. C106 TaxID=2908644 RepID=UPI00202864AD|nr:hypothetical protein [Actinotalea sp. C106]